MSVTKAINILWILEFTMDDDNCIIIKAIAVQ